MMRKTIISSVLFLPVGLMTVALSAQAGDHDPITLDGCLQAAQEVHQGDFVKVEYLSVSPAGVPTYEIEVRDDGGTEWELMCNARTGDIYELETEADSPQDKAFSKGAKVSEDEARKTATDRFGGEIVEIEYEIEADGSPTYEIDLAQPGQDNEFKIEVDAATGDIIEMSVEEWQIGEEPSEEVGQSSDETQAGTS